MIFWSDDSQLPQANVTAGEAERIVDNIAMAVTNLEQPDEQSEDNFELIVEVFDQIDNLIDGNQFTANEDVSGHILLAQ